MRTTALLAFLLLLGCGKNAAPRDASPELDGDALYRLGRFQEAADTYLAEEKRSADRDNSHRLRYLRAQALMSFGDTTARQQALTTLLNLAQDVPPTVFSRLAQNTSAEINTANTLHRSLLLAGAELHQCEERTTSTLHQFEISQETCRETIDQLEQAATSLRDERARLLSQVKQLSETNSEQASRITELENELSELRRIDMGRTP